MVEIAFGCLKSCWRRLQKWNDMLVKNVPTIVVAACVRDSINGGNGGNGRISICDVYSYTYLVLIPV